MRFRANFQKIKQVAGFEYRRQVLNRRFWLSLLGFPLMTAALSLLLFSAIILTRDRSPVGVVGPAGLNLSPAPGDTDTYSFRLYSTEAEAHAALLKHHIQAYFVLWPTYPFIDANDYSFRNTATTQLVYLKKPQAGVHFELEALLRRNLLADLPPEYARRVTNGARVILQSGSLEVPGQVSAFSKMVAAFFAIYGLLGIISIASGYMSNTLSDERNNRVLEVLVTSLSHDQLMIGKVAGQLAVTLTQALVWGGLPVLGLLLAQSLQLPLIGDLFTGPQLAVFAVSALLTLTLVSVLLSVLGITVMDTAEGQLASFFFNFCMIVPVLMYQSLTNAPSGPAALLLTFFPFTSAATLLVRMSFSSVPAWQVLLSLAILAVTTRAAFWLAGRMFWLSLQARTRRKLSLARLLAFFRRVGRPRHA